jgi:hypothetical protein
LLKKRTSKLLVDFNFDPVQKAIWLPAPSEPIYIVLRMYWPKESVLNGSSDPPGIQSAKQ